MLALGSYDSNVYIYQKTGSLYIINETINVGFWVYQVKLIEDLLIISGFADKIFFYKYNGSQYLIDQSIQTAETAILKF